MPARRYPVPLGRSSPVYGTMTRRRDPNASPAAHRRRQRRELSPRATTTSAASAPRVRPSPDTASSGSCGWGRSPPTSVRGCRRWCSGRTLQAHRVERLRRRTRLRPARAAAAAVDRGGVVADALVRRRLLVRPGRAVRVLAGRRRSWPARTTVAVLIFGCVLAIGIGNALNAPTWGAVLPLPRRAGGPRRRHRPELHDDQRQPGHRPRPGRHLLPHPRPGVDLHGQRPHLRGRHRGPPGRALPGRPADRRARMEAAHGRVPGRPPGPPSSGGSSSRWPCSRCSRCRS